MRLPRLPRWRWLSKLAFWRKPSDPYAELAALVAKYPDKVEALLAKAREGKHDVRLYQSIVAPMIGREIPCPDGAKCTKCGSEKLKRIGAPAWGRWGGNVECLTCGHKESLMAHIGKSCFSVEPMEPPV
jgi:hypothetical protein